MSINNNFHHWPSELAAGQYSRSGHLRLKWLCYKIAISDGQIFFSAQFVFIWVKTFKKVYSYLCSNLLGLWQPISHMWYLHTCEYLSGISISGTHLHQPSVSPSNNLLLSWINWIESNHLKLYHNFTYIGMFFPNIRRNLDEKVVFLFAFS